MNILDLRIDHAGYYAQESMIKDIKFELKAGQITGLIGPNGAGKSTTIKAILGLLPYVEGSIDMHTNKHYAYIPETPILYDEMTLWEHLELASAAYDMKQEEFTTQADLLLDQYHLKHVKHQYPVKFSKGMQQKVMLIVSFLKSSDLYVVDEPFMGLDPHAIKEFLDMIKLQRQKGAAILISTHALDTAERICDTFILLTNGRLIAKGDLEELRSQSGLRQGTLFDCFHTLSRLEVQL